jgi:hypothetical protein
MLKDNLFIIFLLMLLLFTYSCEGGKMQQEAVQPISEQAIQDSLKKVAGQRIYFGHQSVGYNILDGIRDVAKPYPQIQLNIVETADPGKLDGKAILAHSTVGYNTDPVSKLNDFSKNLEKGLGNKVDIAFIKFCYVDMRQGDDAGKIFEEYKKTITSLKIKFPRITFVHVTAPLTSHQKDIKTIAKNAIKWIIGRPIRSYRDNIPRNQFNDLLRKEFGGSEPVFDLAAIESTGPDGKRVEDSADGRSFYSMAPGYTYDGGHLNETGRRIVAQKLLLFLAQIPERR